MNKHLTVAGMVGLSLFSALTMASVSPAHAQRQGESQAGADRSVAREPNIDLEARIATDRTQYNGDRAVEITLSAKNYSRFITSVATTKQGLPYELTVRAGRSGRVVFTLSDRTGTQRGRLIRLNPSETQTWRELWDGRDDNGERVSPGVYVVEARIGRQRTVSTEIYLGRGNRPGRPGDDGGWNGGGHNDDGGGGNPERPGWPSRPPNGDQGSYTGDNQGSYGELRATLTANRTTVRPGDSVRLTYTVRNSGSRAVNLLFTSGQQWDVSATNQNGRRIWRESDGKAYIQSLTEISLRPGNDRTFTTTWQVPFTLQPGRYELQALLTTRRSEGALSAPASMTLRVADGRNDDRNDPINRPRWDGRDDDRDGRYDRYGDRGSYTNYENRVPSGIVLGNPTVIYGANSGATLVSPRTLTGRDGAQYIGKKVTVSGRYSGGTTVGGQKGWQLGGDGVLLPVQGTSPTDRDGVSATATGIVRQTSTGQIYLSLP